MRRRLNMVRSHNGKKNGEVLQGTDVEKSPKYIVRRKKQGAELCA